MTAIMINVKPATWSTALDSNIPGGVKLWLASSLCMDNVTTGPESLIVSKLSDTDCGSYLEGETVDRQARGAGWP